MRNKLNRRRRFTGFAGLGALALGLAALLPPVRAWAQQTVCAVVKLQLGQQAALEREAFKANLGLTNNLGDLPLSQMRIDVLITDPNGNSANGQFFIKTTNLQGINAIDGTGTVQPAGAAAAEWLIIPSTGAGGGGTSGVKYTVTARMSFYTGGVPRVTTTFPVTITVLPQPVLTLEYALPFEVFGPQPLLPSVAIATQPFPLGLRVVNVGSGTASNFSVNSSQPQIVDNAQGLAVNFTLLGSYLGSTALTSNSLNIVYGNVPPGGSRQAAWIMASSFAGRFVNFTANFTHAAELGGALTSLIQGVSTYTLIKDVQDDTPGRDAQFDFLINRSAPRDQLERNYEAGLDPLPAPEFIMESDLAGMTPVSDVPGVSTGALSGTNAVLGFVFAVPVPTATWVHAAIPFPLGGQVQTVSATRSDGKVLNPHNFWISQHFNKLTLTFSYRLHVLDFTPAQPGAPSYTLAFAAGALQTPPDPISTLVASAAGPGGVALNWTATGESGSTGAIVGGRYAIYASTDLAAMPSVAASSVVFATSTLALAPQSYALNGLLGNATYQLAVFLANAEGNYSNGASVVRAITLAVPLSPRASSVTTSGFALSWSTAVNAPGAQYRLQLASAPGGVVADTGYAADVSSAAFTGLSLDASYPVTALMRTSAGVPSPAVVVATVTTLAAPPAVAAPSVVAFSSSSLTVAWQYGADPPDTEFLAELSTAPDLTPPSFAGGWIRAASFDFAGLAASTTYYARAKARNRAGVETAYAELGAGQTSAASILPPTGAPGAAFTLAGANFGPFAGTSTRVRFGAGGPLAAVTSWTGARINGVVPVLSVGVYTVYVERQSGATTTALNAGSFAVLPALPSTGTVIALSPADGDQITVSTPTIAASYAAALGVDTTTVVLTLDGAAVPASVRSSAAAFAPTAALSEGTHTVTASVADLGGNVTVATATFLVDTIPPVTVLAVDGLTASATALTVVSTDVLSFVATDAGSGVADTVYLLDVDPNACDFSAYTSTAPAGTCANPYYAGPFSLFAGTHTLAFYSVDAAGNSENYHRVVLTAAAPVYAAVSGDGVATLFSPFSGETVTSVSLSSQPAEAAAAAQFLTPATSFYDLEPSGIPFSSPATLQFAFNPRLFSATTLAIFTFDGVAWTSAAIAGQRLTVLSSAAVQLSGRLAHASLYGVFGPASASPASAWTPWSAQPDPTYGTPSARVLDTKVYNPASKRMIVFAGGGPGGYGIVNDAWVLTNADGTSGIPTWQKLNPVGGPPPAREAHVAVYDQTNNRMIVQGGYTTPGNCGGVIGDAWVLTNADGTGGAPAWTQLAPTGSAPPRRYAGAAYDAVNNRLILNGGGNSGCGAGLNDTWVLTNANGLGGTPAWIQLTPTTPANFPSDSSGGNAAYDPAHNVFMRFLQWNQTVTTWLLSNANGLGGTPAWTQLSVSPAPSVNDWVGRGGTYDADTNTFVFFGGGVSVASETWKLSGANGIGTAQWTKLTPSGPQPDARVWAGLGYTASSGRLVMEGGSKDSWNGTLEVWTLANPFGPAAPATLASIAVRPTYATLSAGATQAFAAAGTFTDGSTRTLTATDGLTWTTSASTVATIDQTGTATAVAAGAATITASSGAIAGTAALTVTPPPSAQAWTQWNAVPDPTYGFPAIRTLQTSVYNTTGKRMIVFAGSTGGRYTDLNDVWVLSNADGVSGTPAWQKLLPTGGPPQARDAHVAVYDQANNRMIIQGGYTTPGNCGGVVSDAWVLTNADGTGGAPAWTQLAPTGSAPPRRYAGAAYDPVNNRLILNGGGNSGCGAGLNDTWVLTNANGLGGTPAWIQLTPTTPANFPSDSSGGNAAYDPAHNVFMRFLQWNQTVTTWLLSNANGLGGTPAWTQLSASPAPSVNDWVGRGGTYDAGTNTFVLFGGGVSVASETWKLSGANGIGTPYWTKLTPSGPQPVQRIWASLAYAPASARLTMYGGSEDGGTNGVNEVWTLSSPFGPAAPATLASIAIRPTYATLAAGATQAFAAAGTFTDGSTRTLTATDGLTWATSASTVATVDQTGTAAAVAAGAATITASSGAIAGTAALTVTPPPSAQAWTQWSAQPDPTYGTPSARVLDTKVYNPASKRMIVFAGGGPGGYGILNDAWVLTNADGTSGMPTWQKLNPVGGPPPAREAHVAVYDQASNRMIVQGGYTTPGNCGGVIGDVWVLTNADGTGGAPAWTQLAPTGSAPPRRYAGAAYDAVNNRLILNGGGNSGCGAGLNDTWVLTNANGLGGTPSWIQLTPTTPANFPSDSSGGNAAYDPAHNVFMRFLQWNQTVTTWLLSNANGLGGTPAWTQLSVSPAPSVNDWVGRGGMYDAGANTFIFFGGGVSVASETWKLSGANGIGTAQWTKLTPGGPQPDGRVWAGLGYTASSGRLVMEGGSKDSWNGTLEVWTLANPFGSVTAPTLTSLSVTSIAPSSGTNGGALGIAAIGTGFDASAMLALKSWDVLHGSWTAANPMGTARADAQVVRLADGRLLVAGGRTGDITSLASAEIFDPASGNWTPTGSLSTDRYDPLLVKFKDGRVLAAGGRKDSHNVSPLDLASAEIYDPATGAWTPTGSLVQARAALLGYVRPDGKVLAAGGFYNGANLSSSELYDPASGTWTTGPVMSTPRNSGAGIALKDGRFMMAGGYGAGSSPLASVEIYDPAANAWTLVTAMATPRAGLSLTVLADGRVLAAGGTTTSGNTTTAEVYDPVANVWSAAGSMTQAHASGKTQLIAGKVLVAGGSDVSGQSQVTEVYDPAANAWALGPTMSSARVYQVLARLADGRVLTAGGAIGGYPNPSLASAEILNMPSTTIAAAGVSVTDAQHLSGTVNLAGAATGYYDAAVSESGGRTASLSAAFRVLTAYYVATSTNGQATLVSASASETVVPVSTASQTTAYGVATSSQHLAALSSFYALLPSPVPFNPPATLSLLFDPTGVDTTTISIYWYNGVSWDSAAVTAQTLQVLGATQAVISGQLAHASLYAVFRQIRDTQPPRTTLLVGAPHFVSSQTFVSPAASLGFAAVDDRSAVGDGLGFGVARTLYAVDTGSFTVYAGSFTLSAEGAHALRFYSVDVVGNAESVQVSTLAVDATAPRTSLLVQGGRQFPGPDAASFYASSDTRLTFPAVDPLVNGVASGVAWTRYQDSTGAFLSYSAPLALAEGAHRLAYQSQDNVANLEVLRSTTVLVDATPPASAVTIGSPTYTAADGTIYVTPAAPVSVSAADPALPSGQAGSGVARVEVSVDGGAFTVYVATLTFAEGRHTLLYRAVDNVGNVETAHTLALQSDATAPQTSLLVQGGRQFPGPDAASFYASSDTRLTFPAVDPLVNGVASGVAWTRYQDSTGAFLSYSAPLALAEGAHRLGYQSQDNVANLEVLRSTTVLVDATAPASTVTIGSPTYTAADGTIYVTPATPVSVSAADPALPSGQAGSGVARVEVSVDGGAFTVYVATLTFAEGRHTLLYRAVDNVGNVETAHMLALQSDATPPITAFKASGAFFAATAPEGTRLYAPAGFVYSLPATDPVVGNVASGVAFTRYRTGSLTNYASGAPAYAPGAFASYVSTFSLAEGIRRVDFQSQDNVGNLELLKSATVFVDATPPATTLGVGAPQYAAGGTLYVSTSTPFTLAAQDPVVQEVASGVSAIFFRRDADPFAPYAAAFTLAPLDGAHAVSYYAADNAGNLEAVKTSTVALDATAPQTSLLVLGGRQFPGPDGRTFYASSDTRLALPAVDPLVNGAASGLAFTRWQDNGGAFTVYVGTLSLAEGAHALGYQSQDNVANLEVLRSTTVLVDATPPASAVTIGSPTYTSGDGTIYVTPATPVFVSAADPALPGGQAGSGVARIEVSVDGAAFAAYAGALTFAEGRHALLYRAVDNVGNVETAHALALQSDATPPVSALVIGQPQFALSSATVLVSSRTPLSIAAADPVVAGVASGVKQSFYSVNGGTFAAFTAPFTLSGADGAQTVSFYSQDNVLNTEAVKVSTMVLDATPPEIALLSPASCDGGICRVVKGAFPVLGTARDAHFAGYVLDYAPGQNATTGYALISSGTVAVSSGALGTWDASKLAGWQTLRLTATDLVQNVASVSLGVYVGDPAALLVLGNHDVFDMPTGVAVGADGTIYVADRNNDRIAVFSSTGAPLAAYGARHEGDDDVKSSTSVLRLNKPTGVAVDAAGDVFVADTGHDRVLELSATGQVLLTIGRRRDERGGLSRPGAFNKPAAVALDAGGRVYVSDTGNHRVQVFSSTGGFLSQIVLPAAPRRDEDERDEDDAVAALGRPLGIALDAAGDLYVADVAGRRVLKYDSTGALRLTIPIPGDAPGQAGRPFGVAVSSSGECLLVSDMQFAHVLKFDVTGTQNLSFGARARGDDAARKAAVIAFRKPAGLALDAAGSLYVADRNAERIEKFGLPTGQATLVVPPARPEDEREEVARDVLDKDGGGTVSRRDHAAVQVPAGALADDLKITVSTMSAQSAAQAGAMGKVADGKGLRPAYAPVEYGPEGTKFAAPVMLTVPYNPALVAQQGLSEDSLKVHYWNKANQDWEALESVVDKAAHTVTAKTPHFSLYQVLGSTGAGYGVLAADASFGLKAAYAFPNPVHSGAVTLRIQPGLADAVSVRVYDVSGRKVHDSSGFSLSTLDDGNGLGAQFTYDHVWDVSGVGSGVYTYVITATKAGQTDIHKTGRIGVAK